MPRKPRLLLCDAVAIITAHEVGSWDELCGRYDVLVPSIVIEEAHFYRDGNGCAIPIDLRQQVHSGQIREYTASLGDYSSTAAMLHPELRVRVDDGEREALTFLRQDNGEDVWFITADGGAIEAAVAFDRGECAQSLDTALKSIGLTKSLSAHHMDRFVAEHKRLGGIRLAEGRALKQ